MTCIADGLSGIMALRPRSAPLHQHGLGLSSSGRFYFLLPFLKRCLKDSGVDKKNYPCYTGCSEDSSFQNYLFKLQLPPR